jgi:hypothetical protein
MICATLELMKTEPHSPEFRCFDAAIKQLLAVPREEYQKRLADWKEAPGSRGPKRRVKQPSGVSPAPADPPQA